MNLPKGWTPSSIGEVFQVNPKHSAEGDRQRLVSFVAMSSVDEYTGTITGAVDRILNDVWTGYTHFADADVIFAKITPCMENGKAAVARSLTNSMACGSTEFYVFRSNGAATPEYLWRYLRQKSFREYAQRHMSGAVGQQRVPKRFLEEHQFPLPPLAEQRRIIAKLDVLTARVDRARAELDRVFSLGTRIRRASLEAAFAGRLTTVFRAEATIDSATEMPEMDDQERGIWKTKALPAEWQWVTFDRFFKDETDAKRKLPENQYQAHGRFPVIDQGKNRVGGFTDNIDLVHPANHPVIVFGDHTRCVKLVKPPFVQGADGVKVLSPAPNVHVGFAKFALLAIEIPAKGYSRHMKFVRKSLWPMPPESEQTTIVERLEAAFASADRIEAEAERARTLLDRVEATILTKAFRGELVPQDPKEESARVLLERIQSARSQPTEALLKAVPGKTMRNGRQGTGKRRLPL